MKLIHVQLSKEKLVALPKEESTFFFALGHVYNEMNALTKMLYWSANTPAHNSAEEQGKFSTMLMFLQILAGKLNESWELFQGSFFGSGISRKLEPSLDAVALAALQSLKKYFGSRNAINLIRNYFAFHYSPEKVFESLPNIEETLELFMYRKSTPNNLFSFAETGIAHALLKFLDDNDLSMTLEEIVDELFDVSLCFAQVSDGIMDAIISRSGEELRLAEPDEVEIKKAKNFYRISIPWFAETEPAGCLSKLGLTIHSSGPGERRDLEAKLYDRER